jgi:hypothetical protein
MVLIIFFIVRLEDQFDSLNVNDGEAAVNEFEIEDYIDPSMKHARYIYFTSTQTLFPFIFLQHLLAT